ncbi:hypothetical protein ANO11243_055900 [Dothideomycetidae sp. 11243]|nr:hypothetical protein ANO11243_055900 [fungal sp. No.11243]
MQTPHLERGDWISGVDNKLRNLDPAHVRNPTRGEGVPIKPSFQDTNPGPSWADRDHRNTLESPAVSRVKEEDLVQEARTDSVATPANAVVPVPVDDIQVCHAVPLDAAPPALTFPTVQAPLKPRLADPDGSIQKKATYRIRRHMLTFQAAMIAANGFLLFWTWYFTRFWWAIIPIISLAVAINTIMVISLTIIRSWKRIKPTERIVPDIPERLILLVPCYNENQEELTRSLDSLIEQEKIEDHQQAILIICDGKVRGPGMTKTCADLLLEDVLTDKDDTHYFTGGYTAWDQQPMDVVVQTGRYRGLPYICIIKQQNQGKRDSLVFVRSFLYYYNLRNTTPTTVLTPQLFDRMACWVAQAARLEKVDALIGMDADTILKSDCIYELVQEGRHPKTLGGRATHKVSVLPGACQLLKVCEDTCGDEVLIDHFGKKPDIDAGLYKQIMASASEDGNHVCCMMTVRPHSQTRQALKSIAYTDVPMNWTVFLSQRRRWSLGASGNDWKLAFGHGVLVFERILSFMNTVTWFITPFLFTAYASFIYVLVVHADLKILYFASLTFIPILYYLTIPFWLIPGFKQKIQYWVGLFIYIVLGPACRTIVIIYTILHMTDFGWGKTRMVVTDDDPVVIKKDATRVPGPKEDGSSSPASSR